MISIDVSQLPGTPNLKRRRLKSRSERLALLRNVTVHV